MTKNQIITHLALKFGLKQSCAKTFFDEVLGQIMRGTMIDGRVVLRGFGSFAVKQKAGRHYPHLQKPGETVYVPAHPVICFKPGKKFGLHLILRKHFQEGEVTFCTAKYGKSTGYRGMVFCDEREIKSEANDEEG